MQKNYVTLCRTFECDVLFEWNLNSNFATLRNSVSCFLSILTNRTIRSSKNELQVRLSRGSQLFQNLKTHCNKFNC